jgi:hypothetical protein
VLSAASEISLFADAALVCVARSYDYTRSGNPTRTLLEGHMAELEARPSCHV